LQMENPLKKIRKHYKRTVKNFDRGAVHQFRVEVKKLRALNRLLFYNKRGKALKIPESINGLYKCTGNIRNLQLQEERVVHFAFKSNAWPKSYISFLGSRQQKLRKEAGKYKHEEPVNSRETKRTTNGMKRLGKKKIRAYVFHQSIILQSLLLIEHFEDDDLHQLRKFLKDILYNWKRIKMFIIPLLPFLFQKKKDINAFTVLLGEFQDVCIALKFLEHEFYPYSSTSEEFMLVNFREELELQKLDLRKRILNIIAPSIIPWYNVNSESFISPCRNGLS
jgi:CHAD domain-containing protein